MGWRVEWDIGGYGGHVRTPERIVEGCEGILGRSRACVKLLDRAGRSVLFAAAYGEGDDRHAPLYGDCAVGPWPCWAWPLAPPALSPGPLRIQIIGQEYVWQFRYPGPDGALQTADDITKIGDGIAPAARPSG